MRPWRGESGWLGSEPKALGGARRASDDEKGLSWIIRSIGRHFSMREGAELKAMLPGAVMNRRPTLGCARASQGFLSNAHPKGMSGRDGAPDRWR
jgi:hypothetical protein